MEFSKVVKERRSVRKFKSELIKREVIELIVEEASFAPSWKHSQTPRYIYIENKEVIQKIAENMILGFEMNEATLKECAGVMIVSYVTQRAGYERDGSFSTPKEAGFEMFDAGVATQTLCLSAHNQGVATVITGYFDEVQIAQLIRLPENQKIGALVAMGIADEEPTAPKRKTLDQLLAFVE